MAVNAASAHPPACGGTFDFVIAGGGTAGLVVAARLTENPHTTVAVIEAGPDNSEDLNVLLSGLTSAQFNNPTYDWSYVTAPQTFDKNRQIAWPRGRQLGGSSAINLQLWNRASKNDIDDWGLLGNDGWTWDELLPYFEKVENFTDPTPQEVRDLDIHYIDPRLHGTKGPVKVSYCPTYDVFREAWNPTFKNLGIDYNGDPFNGVAIGGFTTPFSQDPDTVERSYAANAYYTPNTNRPNLHLFTDSLATKILFENCESGRRTSPLTASGVQYTVNGTTCVANAKKEVILSAGVVNSPHLLELSGIGSSSILRPLGIDVLYENPSVGENLQDHVHTSISFEVDDGLPTFNALSTPGAFEAALNEFLTNKSGILTNQASSASYLSYQQLLQSSHMQSRLPSDPSAYMPSAADLKRVPSLLEQYALITAKVKDPNEALAEQIFLPAGFNYAASANATALYSSPPGNFLTLFGFNLHPYSRGSIHTVSADPTVYPVIDPRYLSNPLDLDILSTIALQTQHVARTQPFASLMKNNATVFATGYSEITPENVEDHVRNTLTSIYHGIGTCAMLPENKGGVVDSRLRVYGTTNLRVVDASIAPLLTRGTIQSFVYAIAEKASDMIKQDCAL